MVSEIRELYENYGVRLFSFIDETVIGPGKQGIPRIRDIASIIMESGIKINFFMTVRAEQVETKLFRELKQAGLRKVEIGIESMAESQLQRYGKNASTADNRRALKILEDLGIFTEAFMIPFDSCLTHDELEQNLSFYEQRLKNRTQEYDVVPLTIGDYLYPYPGTAARKLYEENGWLGSNYYTLFRAREQTITLVQRTVHTFIAMIDSAFPMSFTGLGNLWINENQLPAPVYSRICGICTTLGELLIDVTRWAYKLFSRGPSFNADQVEKMTSDLELFFSRARMVRDELKIILTDHPGLDKPYSSSFKPLNTFTSQLYRLGKSKKKSIVKKMYQNPLKEKEFISFLIDRLTYRWDL